MSAISFHWARYLNVVLRVNPYLQYCNCPGFNFKLTLERQFTNEFSAIDLKLKINWKPARLFTLLWVFKMINNMISLCLVLVASVIFGMFVLCVANRRASKQYWMAYFLSLSSQLQLKLVLWLQHGCEHTVFCSSLMFA